MPRRLRKRRASFKQFAQVLERSPARAQVSAGRALTIADFAVGVTLPYAAKAKIPVGGFPEIERWHARLNELPAWREPFPATKTTAAA